MRASKRSAVSPVGPMPGGKGCSWTSAILMMGCVMAWSPWSGRRLCASARLVADRFDIVAIGIEHERAVVMLVIVGTQSRRAVVGGAGLEGGAMERHHGRAV